MQLGYEFDLILWILIRLLRVKQYLYHLVYDKNHFTLKIKYMNTKKVTIYMLRIHKTPNWETVLLIMCIHHTYFPTTFVRRANGSEYGLHVKLQHIWYDNFKEAPFLC